MTRNHSADDTPSGKSARLASLGRLAEIACWIEATTFKPGNVHPDAAFENLSYEDFLVSAAAIRPIFDRAHENTIGDTIRDAIAATQDVVGSNTNLGIVLLLAPLAKIPEPVCLRTTAERDALRIAIRTVLDATTIEDARAIYEAIRLANAGGLGEVAKGDISQEPRRSLVPMMRLAREHDFIARQYSDEYREVVDQGVVIFLDYWKSDENLERAVQCVFLGLLGKFPDSLIERKCGRALAVEASRRAGEALQAGFPATEDGWHRFEEFDVWLREDGHRRNPGTTADLTAAVLFLLLRSGIIPQAARIGRRRASRE